MHRYSTAHVLAMSLTALAYLIPMVIMFWACLRLPVPKHLPIKVRFARYVQVATIVVCTLIAVATQPYALPGAVPSEILLVLKDLGNIVGSLGGAAIAVMLIEQRSHLQLVKQIWLAGAAVLVEYLQWRMGLLAWPTFGTMLFCVAMYWYSARTFMVLHGRTQNFFLRSRYRTLYLGYFFYGAYSLGRAFQIPFVPPEARIVLGVLNRTSLSLATTLICLGLLMPRWLATFGVGIETIWFSQRYLDRLFGLVGMLHDLQLEVQAPQREGLVKLARRLAVELLTSPDRVAVTAVVARIAPLRLVRYNGQSTALDVEASGADAPEFSVGFQHFAEVYDCLQFLMSPGRLPPDAPVEAQIVKAVALHLDGMGLDAVTDETSPEVTSALARVIAT